MNVIVGISDFFYILVEMIIGWKVIIEVVCTLCFKNVLLVLSFHSIQCLIILTILKLFVPKFVMR